MGREPKPMDIGDLPELLRVVEEVRKTQVPRVLRRNKEDLAILMPAGHITRSRPKRVKTKVDREAFRSAFGAWKDIVDADALKRDLASARGSRRPPVEL
ncbi:MAG: hypothetical protein HYY30_02065 [Chloroflexi bacterium]|nr:hypothetical protein [Chloroflexota bacterium]